MLPAEKFEFRSLIEGRAGKICCLLILIYAAISSFYIFYGAVNNDEGWYLYASKLVYAAKLPYMDFSYTQSPLLPYIYGIFQLIGGPGFYIGRFTSLFFGVLTCILAVKIAEKWGGKETAVLTLALITINQYTVYFFTLVKPYALTAFLMVLSLYFLVENKIKNPTRGLLSVFFMGLAVGVRLSVLPALLLLVLYLLYTEREHQVSRILYLGAGLVAVGFWFLPLLIINKDRLWFNLVGYHLQRAGHMSLMDSLDNKVSVIFYTLDKYFALIILMLAGLILHLHRKYSPSYAKDYLLYLITLSMCLLHFLQKPTYTDYQVILVPFASLLAGYGFMEIYQAAKDNSARIGLTAILLFMILLAPVSQNTAVVDLSGGKRPIQEIAEMAKYIQDHTPPQGQLLLFSTYVAVEAHRAVLPGLEMSICSYYPDWSGDKAEKYKVLNKPLLHQYLESQRASAVLLTNFEIELLQIKADTLHLLEKNYYLAKTMQHWGQWKDTAYLYLPKKVQN